MDSLLAVEYYSVKQLLLGRYVNFFHSLRNSLSKEVRIIANMVGRSARSTTGRNLLGIERETGLDPWRDQAWVIREGVKRSEVPPLEGWRLQYLSKLLKARRALEVQCEDVDQITLIINSLCSS